MPLKPPPHKMRLWLPAAEKHFALSNENVPFDPDGSWDHSYVVLDTAPTRDGSKMREEGFLRIRRTASPDNGPFTLDIELLALKQSFGSFRSTIQVQCRPDRLGTPVAWKFSSVSSDNKGKPVDLTRVEEEGRVENGHNIWQNRKARRRKAPDLFTSNWAIFDAVQRFGKEPFEPIQFDMLEDLDLLKPNQRLTYWGTTEVELGGRTMKLTGYQQIGEGILPYHYWLDASGRVILAHGALRGFMFNPNARSLAGGRALPGRTTR